MHKIKIVVTGPESSGKSTLSQQICEVFDTCFCPEFARIFLQDLGRNYRFEDLAKITRGQIALEDWYSHKTDNLLICDTDLLVIYIWYLYKYKIDNRLIFNQLKERLANVYFLTKPDFDWQPDVLREHPEERWVLFELYEKLMIDIGARYFVLAGSEKERLHISIQIINQFMPNSLPH
jgi:nicotinamide riboside kinase